MSPISHPGSPEAVQTNTLNPYARYLQQENSQIFFLFMSSESVPASTAHMPSLSPMM